MTDSSDSLPPPEDGAKTSRAIPSENHAELIERYRPYVRAIAEKVRAGVSAEWSVDQLMEFGMVGLVEAAERPPRMDENFMTRAYYAIRGEIYDGIRRAGGRLGKGDAKALFETRANDFLSTMTRDTREDNPFAFAVADLAESVQSLAVVYIASSDAIGADGMEGARLLLRETLAELHDHERKLFKLLYYRGLNLAEAAERLGLSKARVQRLHQRVLQKTHEALESKFTP